jgi:uncharacterized protein YoxC
MLVRKRKEKLSKKKKKYPETDEDDNLQSIRSWIRKIEQTITSVSSRLSAVEKRLSGWTSESDDLKTIGIEGPIETLFLHIPKKNIPETVRVLDSELTFLHNELAKQQEETTLLKEHLGGIENTHITMNTEVQGIQTAITNINTTLKSRVNKTEHHEPLVMHLGSLEVPIEFTGIIGGLLVFLITGLILIGQKEILLSPWFLIPVGLLLIGFALLKMIRNRSHQTYQPFLPTPLDVPTTSLDQHTLEQNDG